METTFIYGLFDPRDKRLRYIGKSNNPKMRLDAHIREIRWYGFRNSHKNNWIKSLLVNNLFPLIEILEEVPITCWEKYEIGWIQRAKEAGCSLVNSSMGGEGVKGYTFTEEHRKKISISLRGREPWNKGISPSDETKMKISKANKGYSHTYEARRKMSEKIKLAWKRKDYKQSPKQIEANKNRDHTVSKETKEKLRQASLGNKYGKLLAGKQKSEEHKKKISEGLKGRIFTEEHRARLSKTSKERLKSNELRKRLSEANKGKQLGNKNALGHKHTEETKIKISESSKLMWAKKRKNNE